MKILDHGTDTYVSELSRLARRGDDDLSRVEPAVRAILDAVRSRGDAAVHEQTLRIDRRRADPLVYDRAALDRALASTPAHARDTLSFAAERIRAFHEHQRESSVRFTDDAGVALGWRVRALRRVGVYAPGGKARYPSSVLMCAVPAKVAGVPDVFVASPNPGTDVLAAAAIAGASAVFDIGGAIAVGALAYGTDSVPRVDKIVGPGNLYVTAAKKLVYGTVAIDGLAGPSEILVVADDDASPDVVAADLLSQAEHDEAAYPLLVAFSRRFAERVRERVGQRLRTLPREEIASVSVRERGCAFVVGDRTEAARVATELAAEHLALHVRDPSGLFDQIGAAGAVFLGAHTPEAAGDYLAGPSHVLPTGGAVRFASPLGVPDFVVRTSVIEYSEEALRRHERAITTFARLEGLEAHAQAVEVRTSRGDGSEGGG